MPRQISDLVLLNQLDQLMVYGRAMLILRCYRLGYIPVPDYIVSSRSIFQGCRHTIW